MKLYLKLITLLFYVAPSVCLAIDNVQVMGLFPGKVVLTVDGSRYVLKQGEMTPEGVRFIRQHGEGVILEVAGEQAAYELGSVISTSFVEPAKTSKTLYSDKHGMFRTTGSINGQTVNFLLDTGATTVAMNANEAKRLGIQFRLYGKKTHAQTASGIATAYALNLKIVKVGELMQRNVRAIVIDGNYPRDVLLGMSFLDRIKVEKSGNTLKLEQRK